MGRDCGNRVSSASVVRLVPTWEYEVVQAIPGADSVLNDLGDCGWELIGVVNNGASNVLLYFKRRKEHPCRMPFSITDELNNMKACGA